MGYDVAIFLATVVIHLASRVGYDTNIYIVDHNINVAHVPGPDCNQRLALVTNTFRNVAAVTL